MMKFFNSDPVIIKLKNGMRVHLINDKSVATYAGLIIGFGSLHLKYAIDGVNYKLPAGSAHFLEHLMFAMPNDDDALVKLSNLGFEANAMTSYRYTTYTLSGISDFLSALKYLLEVIDTPYFDANDVLIERGIIKEEIAMYDDDIDSHLGDLLLKQIYFHHPLKHDIGGTANSIKKIKRETLVQMYQHFYHHSNRTLVISGPIDIDLYLDFFKQYQASFDDSSCAKVELFNYNEPKKVVVNQERITLEVLTSKLAMGLKLSLNDLKENKLKYENAAMCLLNLLIGPTSKFYQNALSNNLIDRKFSFQIISEEDCFVIMIVNNSQNSDLLYQKLNEVIFTDGLSLICEDDFKLFKRAYLGSFIQMLNSFEFKNFVYSRYIVDGYSLNDVFKLINELSFDDVISFYNLLKEASVSVLYGDSI